MKKRSIKFEINFTNKWLYTFIFLGIILVAGISVFAYNSGQDPSVMGHSVDEIEGFEENVLALIQEVNPSNSNECGEDQLVLDTYLNGKVDNVLPWNGWGVGRALPQTCFTLSGCKMVQKVYDKNGLFAIRAATFIQFEDKWIISTETNTYINGDGKFTHLFPSLDNGKLVIMDDYSDGEVNSLQISIRDLSSSYGQKVYIC